MDRDERASEPFGRREVLTGGAVAAGLAWSTPMIRSVNLTAIVGSPPPTSTTIPEPTIYIFAGAFHAPGLLAQTDDCLLRGKYEGTAMLSSLGSSTIFLDFCVVATSSPFALDHGEFRIEAPAGSVGGPVTAGFLEFDADLHLEMVIDNGTGAYAGASGAATFDGALDDTVVHGIKGDITGSFSA